MCHRASQLNVPHTLTAYSCQGYFYTALLTYNTTVLETLVLTAQTFVIFYGSKYFGAKQSIAFRLERSVVNCLRLFYLTVGP